MPRLLLWGDSHAAQLYPGLTDLKRKVDFDIVQWTAAACPSTRIPIVGEDRACPERRHAAIAALKRLDPDVVLVASAWELYSAGNSEKMILRATGDDIRWLQESGVRHIVIFGPGPTWEPPLPLGLFVQMRLRRSEEVPRWLGAVSDGAWDLDTAMAAQAAIAGVQYVSPLREFCNRQGCRTLGDPRQVRPDLLFRDRDHLTITGSHLLVESAERQILGSR